MHWVHPTNNHKQISIHLAIFAQYTIVIKRETDRQTDRQRDRQMDGHIGRPVWLDWCRVAAVDWLSHLVSRNTSCLQRPPVNQCIQLCHVITVDPASHTVMSNRHARTQAGRQAGRQTLTRSYADAKGLHDKPHIWNITLEKACNTGMTFKDTQVITIVSLPVSGLFLQHHYLSPFLRYYHFSSACHVACDLKKSFIINKKV